MTPRTRPKTLATVRLYGANHTQPRFMTDMARERASAPLTRQLSTWAKVRAALSRATWGDVAAVVLFAVTFVSMVLALAVWS